jgi:hypothetical protein
MAGEGGKDAVGQFRPLGGAGVQQQRAKFVEGRERGRISNSTILIIHVI